MPKAVRTTTVIVLSLLFIASLATYHTSEIKAEPTPTETPTPEPGPPPGNPTIELTHVQTGHDNITFTLRSNYDINWDNPPQITIYKGGSCSGDDTYKSDKDFTEKGTRKGEYVWNFDYWGMGGRFYLFSPGC